MANEKQLLIDRIYMLLSDLSIESLKSVYSAVWNMREGGKSTDELLRIYHQNAARSRSKHFKADI